MNLINLRQSFIIIYFVNTALLKKEETSTWSIK